MLPAPPPPHLTPELWSFSPVRDTLQNFMSLQIPKEKQELKQPLLAFQAARILLLLLLHLDHGAIPYFKIEA